MMESNVSSMTVDWTSKPIIQVSSEVLLFVGIFLTIVAVISTLGNGSFIIVLVRRRSFRRDAHLLLLMSMACCDLGVSIFGYPFTIISCLSGSWVFNDIVCKMYAFVCYTLSLISANTLVVISVFRYIIICKPQSKNRLTPRLSCMCVAGTVFYSLFWTLSPFFGWSSYTQEPWDASCSFDWNDSSISGISYAIATTIFCYVLQLSVMCVCYYKIYARVSHLKLDPLTPSPPSEENKSFLTRLCFDAALNFESSQPFSHHRNQRAYKIEIQVFKLNLLMVLTFFIIWSPYAILSFVSIYYPDLSDFWYIFPTVFAKMSCMMNPLLYGLTNASLRREFRQLWHDMCCQTKSELDIEEHHCHPPRGGDTKDGDINRSVYNKEGVYLGEGNQGACTCSGCVESRREVEMLILLQTQRARDSELNTTPVVSIIQPEQHSSNRRENK